MNILTIGSGAREHAIVSALHCSTQKPTLFCFGTSLNPGIMRLCAEYSVLDIMNPADVAEKAKLLHIDFAIIGPEAPLEAGVADALWAAGIPTIGPKKALAQIETSKNFARDLMQKYHIPGLPQYQTFNEMTGILEFLTQLGDGNYVVKACGLMGGKGVKVAGDHLHSFDDALQFCKEIFKLGQTVLIEEKLIGQEFSFMCFSDGTHLIPMPLVQDHKRAFAGDQGPNTGGMGSYSMPDHSLPFLTQQDVAAAFRINQAVVEALQQACHEKYIGILYGSFIATKKGVAVIEFNARFGDPESLNVLSILASDFVDLCMALVTGNLTDDKAHFAAKATVCKYVVPEGYPDAPKKNQLLDLSHITNTYSTPFYFASVDDREGNIYALGSRTIAFVGVAKTLQEAEKMAETAASEIKGPFFHREDIGTNTLIQSRITHMHEIRNERVQSA